MEALGQPRMQLVEGPAPVADLLEETSDVKWANLQRTQQGGIVYFRVRLEVYGVPCAAGSTTWRMDDKSLTLTHPEGPMRFVLSSAPSKACLRYLRRPLGLKPCKSTRVSCWKRVSCLSGAQRCLSSNP